MKKFLVGLILGIPLGVLLGPSVANAVWFIASKCAPRFAGLAPGVTVEGIRAVELGMSEAQVRELLGAPVASGPTETRYDRDFVPQYGCDSFAYEYGRPSGAWWPMLWVGFRDGKVDGVYGKQYGPFDDLGVYSRNATICPPEDPRRAVGCQWERPEFEETFPRRKS